MAVRAEAKRFSVDPLEEMVHRILPGLRLDSRDLKKVVPSFAKDPAVVAKIESAIKQLSTRHLLVHGDARDLKHVADESVHLIVTSPPYWTLKEYNKGENQLGAVEDYDEFNRELDRVWAECFRVLVPGGRLIVVVGDVCLSRREYGRHVVFPLHATIQEHCRVIGFDNLAPIIWHKIANASHEVDGGGSGFLGKPYEPNAIIKNDIEFILMQRKPGGYRSPTPAMRTLSVISEADHREWFRQIWRIPGASTREHPAPYPVDLAARLIRMFSFVGDTVLDPFAGTGTTSVAAAHWGRNSIAYEIDWSYFRHAVARIERERANLFSQIVLELAGYGPNGRGVGPIRGGTP